MMMNVLVNDGLRRVLNCSPELPWEVKASTLSELSLFLKQAGHSEQYRHRVIDTVIGKYIQMLVDDKEGNKPLYRSKEEMIIQKSKKIKGHDWYKEKGHKYLVKVPINKDQELANEIKGYIEDITTSKVMIQESLGPTVVNSLRKANPSPPATCSRANCKPCLHGLQEMKCYKPNIGYRIVCNRSPCNASLDMSPKALQTDPLRKQLESLRNIRNVPVLYEGESFRSSFSRCHSHFQKYLSSSEKVRNSSILWIHANTHHGGVIGSNNGEKDYIFVTTGYFKDNCSRQNDEGRRQSLMEAFQAQGKVILLNSKLDFIQPMRTQLALVNKNVNKTPGVPDGQTSALPVRIDLNLAPSSKVPRKTTKSAPVVPMKTTITAPLVPRKSTILPSVPRKSTQGRRPLQGIRRSNINHHTFHPIGFSTPDKAPALPLVVNVSPIKKKNIQQYLDECDFSKEDEDFEIMNKLGLSCAKLSSTDTNDEELKYDLIERKKVKFTIDTNF